MVLRTVGGHPDAMGTVSAAHAPRTWEEVGFQRPTEPALGAFVKGRRRLLVRGFKSEASGYEELTDEPDGRFFVDSSLINEPQSLPTTVKTGDILLLLGQFEHDDETALFAPVRVAKVGARQGDWVRVWSIGDDEIAASLGWRWYGIVRGDIPKPLWAVISDLALSGAAADAKQRRQVLDLFSLA